MIRVDEDDPVGEVELSFPYRDVQIRKGVDPKELFELTTEIGRGKFGTVYKCREKNTNLNLAAKFIGVSKKEDRRNVEREVEIMRSLQHPRLLQIYDAFENGKMMCVILELIEGGELFERVIDDDFVLTEKSCTVFMRQICEGIDFIHKQRILHLDMKPENILCLTKTGNRIKIIDFGLARKYDPDKKLQVLFGTPEFVAPEVVNFDRIGYGTDMWSVGVICYVLLSGLSPFMGATDVETMANVTVGKYDFDDDAFREISDNAKDFISKLLVKDMSTRMSAEDCLKHAWLIRHTSPDASSMDVTKDNLRQFVERWNEHPNSPYVFESSYHIIAPCSGQLQLSESLQSLEGMSPSPCGSIESSFDSDDELDSSLNNNNDNYLTISSPDHYRRASDSTCVLKGTDVAERLNLADEIRKLTDKLFQLSTMPEFTTTNSESKSKIDTNVNITKRKTSNLTDNSNVSIISANSTIKHSTIPRSPSIMINGGFKNNALPKDHSRSPNCDVPWRRPKYRVTNSSRDVPLSPKSTANSLSKQFQSELPSFSSPMSYKTRSFTTSTTLGNSTHSIESTANGTKDMLLKLLEQWDGPQVPPRLNIRHGSVTPDMNENDSVGQRTISSLNMFFQSRSVNKKNHPFTKSN